jgi:hypothetical protein
MTSSIAPANNSGAILTNKGFLPPIRSMVSLTA